MPDDAVTVTEDAITVRKTVDTEQFQTVAVVLELASEREEVTRVQVIDTIPDGVPMDDIGFHLDYGAEHWSVDEGTVVFERDLEPEEQYTTIYGIRDYPEDELEALQREPEVGLIDAGAEDLESVVDEERSDVIRDFLSGETELSGLEETIGSAPDDSATAEPATPDTDAPEPAEPEPAAVGSDAEAEPAEAADVAEESPPEPAPEPAGAAESPEEAADAGGEEVDEEEEVSVPLSGGIVRVLIKELREGDVDPEHRRVLRDELLEADGTMEARVSHLQQRMSDLEAYTDALEQFIVEEGGAQAVLADLRSDIEGLESEIESTPERLEDAIDRIDAIEDRVDTVADDAQAALDRSDGIDDRIAGLEDQVAGFDDRIDDLRQELDSKASALEQEIEALEGELEKLEEFQQRLKSVFGNEGGPAGPT